MIDGLRRGAPLAERAGIALVIEPLNRDRPSRLFADDCDEAVEVLQAVDSPNVRMLFDLYHQQIPRAT
jgi:hydroxypyruvate isomerase